jgi:small-conductance mechanosensitive channel
MAKQFSSNRRKYRLVRNIMITVLKMVLCGALWYSFTALEDVYARTELLGRLAHAVYSFLTANILIDVLHNVVVLWYMRKIRQQHEVRGNFVLGINRISAVLNAVFVIIALMLLFKIDPREFITSITIVAAAIALIFRDYITNMISGLLIMFSDQLTIGDRIKLGEHEGKVLDITLANMVLQSEDDDLVLIPNNLFFTATMMNRSAGHSRKVSFEFELPVSFGGNRELLEEKLKQALSAAQQDAVNMQTFRLKILALQKDHIRYKVQFVLNRQNRQQQSQLKRLLYDEVLRVYAAQQLVVKSS